MVIISLIRREENNGAFSNFNRGYINWLIDTKKVKAKPPSVTLLRISDSESSIFQEWPPSPIDYAIILKNLKEYKAKLIAIEPSMSWNNAGEGLLETLRTASLKYNKGELLMGAVFQMDQSVFESNDKLINLLNPISNISGDIKRIPEFTMIDPLPDRRLTSIGIPFGFTSIDMAEQDKMNNPLKVPLLARIKEAIVPSFALRAIMMEQDMNSNDVTIHLGDKIAFSNGTTIPIDSQGSFEAFTGSRPDINKEDINILSLPQEELDESQLRSLSNRIILVGIDTKTEQIIPFRFGVKISNAERIALSIATIQSNLFIKSSSSFYEYFIWVSIILLGLYLIRLKRSKAVARSLLAIIIYLAVNMVLFQSNNQWVSPMTPLSLMTCILITSWTLCPKMEG
ncbi:MAG: CHASE2 domain-containing protein [Verrucomicrobiales bacterium]|mgnify:FL=1|nr:CHASE2 domain-containing protein [Verrucomicrobiales bacterium]